MRSDGALAHLVNEYTGYAVKGTERPAAIYFSSDGRNAPEYAFTGKPFHYYGGINIRSDGCVKPLHVIVRVAREDGASGLQISVMLRLERQIWPEHVLHALTHTLPWVLPGAGPATVKAAASWLAPSRDAEHAA
jgi:hypothetical protein